MIDIVERLRDPTVAYLLASQPDCALEAADEIEFLRTQNAALTDRLEAAERELETERMRLVACGVAALGYFEGCTKEYTSASLDDVLNLRKRLEAAERERDALRAKIEAMERQDGKKDVRASEQSIQDVAMIARNGIDRIIELERENKRLIALAEKDEGSAGNQVMIKNQTPDSWLRAVDEALVVAHLGVADAEDSYEMAKRMLNELIRWHTDVATDPAVNGGFKLVPADAQPVPNVPDGWKLVPIEPTPEMLASAWGIDACDIAGTYAAMLAAAPEDKT